ncbi:hypothetical protein Tco_1533877 [Tanacetum coccineum]
MVDKQDLLKLYGLVVKYYENHPVTGVGLMLWGDLQVLIDSQEGSKGYFVWNHQSLWQIRSWRLYTLSNVHVLETVSVEVLYMFADVSYPLSVMLMERMLKHKLEIDKDVFNKATNTSHYMVIEGVLMKRQDAAFSRDIQLICAEFSSIQVKPQADWMYVVPTVENSPDWQERVENGVVELYFVRTEYQLADIFTKPLAQERLKILINKLGMRIMSPETLKNLVDEEEE